MSEKPLPEPLYGCHTCYQERTFPASDLYWSEKLKGWYCEDCWSEADEHWNGDELDDYGVSLCAELRIRGLSR